MVRSKQKRNEDVVVVGVGVVGCECCWVFVGVSCFEEGMGNWWEEEQSANGDWISLQNGTPKNPTPHFPNLMSLVAFLLCLLLLLLLLVCLSIYLFDSLNVFMSGWLVGWMVCLLKLFVFLIVLYVCLNLWLFVCSSMGKIPSPILQHL